MLQQYNHFCNISHDHYTHATDYKPKAWKWILEENTRKLLYDKFKYVIDRSQFYCQNLSSNICEFFLQIVEINSQKKMLQKKWNIFCLLG